MISRLAVIFIQELGKILNDSTTSAQVREDSYSVLLILYELCFQMISHSPYRERFLLYLEAQAEMNHGHNPKVDPRNN